MESLIVYTESAEQLKTVKAVLKALKVQFEPQDEAFPQHLLRSIEISRKQHENGETISLQEFKEKHLSKK
jgi:hypothetical protein